jgi:hypothetical protein
MPDSVGKRWYQKGAVQAAFVAGALSFALAFLRPEPAPQVIVIPPPPVETPAGSVTPIDPTPDPTPEPNTPPPQPGRSTSGNPAPAEITVTLQEGEQTAVMGDQISLAAGFTHIGDEEVATLHLNGEPHAILGAGGRFKITTSEGTFSVFILKTDFEAKTMRVKVSASR